MKKILTVALFIFISRFCAGQTYQLSQFTEATPPKPYTTDWYPLNRAPDYSVSLVKGKLQINKFQYGSIPTVDLPNGSLIGIDRGEFGGNVYYKPKDSTKRVTYVNGKPTVRNRWEMYQLTANLKKATEGAIPLMPANPLSFFKYRDSLYLIEGLAHMGSSSGSLNSITYKADSFKISRVLTFEDAPQAICQYHNKIYIVSMEGLYIISRLKKERIFDHMFWDALYPNSVVVKNKHHVYLGIRGGYVMLDPIKKLVAFYKYNK